VAARRPATSGDGKKAKVCFAPAIDAKVLSRVKMSEVSNHRLMDSGRRGEIDSGGRETFADSAL